MPVDRLKKVYISFILVFICLLNSTVFSSYLVDSAGYENNVFRFESFERIPSSPFNKKYNLHRNVFLKRQLSNGLLAIAREKENCGIISAVFIIKVGAMEEMHSQCGIVNVIQQMLPKTKIDGNLSLETLAEKDGCILKTSSAPDFAKITLVSTTDVFEQNFKRIARVLKNPSFKPEDLAQIKENLLYRIENNTGAYDAIRELFLKHFYRYHPYRYPVHGFENTIKKLQVDDLDDFYKKYYSANRMSVTICGDILGHKALNLIEKNLDNLPYREINVVDIPWEPVRQEKKLYLATSSNTAWLFVGFPAPGVRSPDFPAVKMLGSLLGEGLSSRLFVELREKEGLAYELSSRYPMLEGPSHLIFYVVTTQGNLRRCRRKLFREINRIKTEPISRRELEATRRKVLASYLLKLQSNKNRAFYTSFYAAMGLDPDFQQVLNSRIKAVTAADIQAAARKYLENYTLLYVESRPDQFEDD